MKFFKEALTTKESNDFIMLQHTINPNTIFDMNLLEKQASKQEIDYYNQHGIWKWDDETVELYKEAIEKNPYVRTYWKDAITNAQKIYNQEAILKILSYQSKEGQFLLTGVQVPNKHNLLEQLPSGFGDFGYHSGLIVNRENNIIKCNMKSETPFLEKIQYNGKGGIFGEQAKMVRKLDYHNLENEIRGFHFVKGACNPCANIDDTIHYSCPFELNVEPNPNEGISPIWKKLWNLHY